MSNNFLLKQLASAVAHSHRYFNCQDEAYCEFCLVCLHDGEPHKEGCVVLVAQQILEEDNE